MSICKAQSRQWQRLSVAVAFMVGRNKHKIKVCRPRPLNLSTRGAKVCWVWGCGGIRIHVAGVGRRAIGWLRWINWIWLYDWGFGKVAGDAKLE